jgi:UDP-3-O-[3-hydroxymyristoyl] N-acetylglucosamine deacetylase
MQKSLGQTFSVSGIGLHLGVESTVTLKPSPVNTGRYFVRVDLPGTPSIPAQIQSVGQTVLSTELSANDAQVKTVEHLLAALIGSKVDNVCIEINGPEVPLLDGSAQIWLENIQKAGIVEQSTTAATEVIVVTEPIWVRKGDAFVAALPNLEGTRFSYGIDFPYQVIGNQWFSWSIEKDDFSQLIAPARTFGFADQIEQLRQNGLVKGGSLDNALVCDQDKWLNPPLRFDNEPVRHKLLDLLGDISLLGRLPKAHIIAYKASHQLHLELVREILKQIESP